MRDIPLILGAVLALLGVCTLAHVLVSGYSADGATSPCSRLSACAGPSCCGSWPGRPARWPRHPCWRCFAARRAGRPLGMADVCELGRSRQRGRRPRGAGATHHPGDAHPGQPHRRRAGLGPPPGYGRAGPAQRVSGARSAPSARTAVGQPSHAAGLLSRPWRREAGPRAGLVPNRFHPGAPARLRGGRRRRLMVRVG